MTDAIAFLLPPCLKILVGIRRLMQNRVWLEISPRVKMVSIQQLQYQVWRIEEKTTSGGFLFDSVLRLSFDLVRSFTIKMLYLQ